VACGWPDELRAMIGRIAGTLIEKNPPEVLVEAGGIGYEIDVPMSTSTTCLHWASGSLC